jgi:3-oxoadipate enol-lactonase
VVNANNVELFILINRKKMKLISNDIKIFEEGNNSALPVIFIHGFPFDHNMWKEQISELSTDFYCISYDIRGLGESLAGDGQYTIEMFTDDLFSVINELGIGKPVLCGLSMGGYIALRAVEKTESKFKGLILCDTKSGADSNDVKLKRAEGIKTINKEGLEPFVTNFMRNCFADNFRINEKLKYQELVDRAVTFDPVGVKGCLLAMAGRTDTTSYLSKIKIPTLILCGEKDSLLPPDIMKEMADKISNAEFFVVPDSGHIISIENPVFVSDMLFHFLKKIELTNI